MSQPRVELPVEKPQVQLSGPIVPVTFVGGRTRKLPIRQEGEAGRVHDENCVAFTSHGEQPCNCGA